METVRAVLFDIGGVTIRLAEEYFPLWAKDSQYPDRESFFDAWKSCRAIPRLETGGYPECQEGELAFAADLISEMGMAKQADVFLEEYRRFVAEPFSGMRELLSDLEKRCITACFSNTSALHWDLLCNQYDLENWFQQVYLSYRIGRMKPDPEAYRTVLDKMGIPAGEILFLDDNLQNVEAGLHMGLQAVQVKGFSEVREALYHTGVSWEGL